MGLPCALWLVPLANVQLQLQPYSKTLPPSTHLHLPSSPHHPHAVPVPSRPCLHAPPPPLTLHPPPCPRCHLILANLRKPGDKGYKIPKGFLFNYVTCANYTCEVWGWLLFTVATQTVAAGLFIAAGTFQMAVWAKGKHKRLRKQFDGQEGREKYPKRWIMLPPFY